MTKPVTNWQARYESGETGWDIGHVSTPLKTYFDQLENKELKILVPGGGNGYEAAYLHQQGFENVFLLDIAPKPLSDFSTNHPYFPKEHLIAGNFFEHKQSYDLIVEQTFFCAINPSDRQEYAQKTHELLLPKGKLMGLLWSVPLNADHPPFGGSKAEYLNYFNPLFNIHVLDNAYNSIQPRAGRELFLLAQKNYMT
jgi:hypothetical protein